VNAETAQKRYVCPLQAFFIISAGRAKSKTLCMANPFGSQKARHISLAPDFCFLTLARWNLPLFYGKIDQTNQEYCDEIRLAG
jgi:hypothetical protein